MAMWCILAAPLFMSVDLRSIKASSRELLQNKFAIEVNQDALGKQGQMTKQVTKFPPICKNLREMMITGNCVNL